MPITNRTFGAEIELFLPIGASREELATALRAAGINAETQRYNHTTTTCWKLVDDGSLGDYRRGVEIVSPILSGEQGIADLTTVLNTVTAFGCSVNKKCGFHVHVGARDLTVAQLQNIAINFANFETAFDQLVAPSRRGNMNGYLRSNILSYGLPIVNANINAAIDNLMQARTVQQIVVIACAASNRYPNPTRYRKLNFDAIGRHGTIEFRQHQGTIDAAKAVNWVKLCLAFVDKSLTNKTRKRRSMQNQDLAWELRALLNWTGVSDESVEFFKARAKLLKDADEAREARRETRRRRRTTVTA